MQTSLQVMHTYVKNWTQTAGHQKPYLLRSGQSFLASLQRKTTVKQFWGLWLWKRLTGTIQQYPGHTSTPMVQLKCHKKQRMWSLHQVSRQTSILYVSTWWDTVLKLQSWSPSTAECHRNHHFVGRKAQESSLPHRLTISPASPHIWWTWHKAKEARTEHQHLRSDYLCCSSVDTGTHLH